MMRRKNPSGNSSTLVWIGALAVGGYLIYQNRGSISAAIGISPTGIPAPTPSATQTSGTSAKQQNPPPPPRPGNVSLLGGIWPALAAQAQMNPTYQQTGTLTGSEWNYLVGQATGTTPGAVPGDSGQPMSLQIYANLLNAANMVPSTGGQLAAAALLDQCLAKAGVNPAAMAECGAQYAAGVAGLGVLPADLLLGVRAPSIVPIHLIHHGGGVRWMA